MFLICTLRGKRKIKFEDLNWNNTENQNHAENYVWRLVQRENVGRRKFFNGDTRKQFYGLLAQAVICYLLRRPLPQAGGFDEGIDLVINNNTIDIKTTIRNVNVKPTYPVNLLDCQYRDEKYKNDYYIFCSFNAKENILEILGLLKKEDVEKYGKYFSETDKSFNAFGQAINANVARWEIPISCLVPINSINDIIDYFE